MVLLKPKSTSFFLNCQPPVWSGKKYFSNLCSKLTMLNFNSLIIIFYTQSLHLISDYFLLNKSS